MKVKICACGMKFTHKGKECGICQLDKKLGKKSPVIYKGDVRLFNKYDYR